ncbi:hypothetical protein D3C79_945620 [compost metagenome]
MISVVQQQRQLRAHAQPQTQFRGRYRQMQVHHDVIPCPLSRIVSGLLSDLTQPPAKHMACDDDLNVHAFA